MSLSFKGIHACINLGIRLDFRHVTRQGGEASLTLWKSCMTMPLSDNPHSRISFLFFPDATTSDPERREVTGGHVSWPPKSAFQRAGNWSGEIGISRWTSTLSDRGLKSDPRGVKVPDGPAHGVSGPLRSQQRRVRARPQLLWSHDRGLRRPRGPPRDGERPPRHADRQRRGWPSQPQGETGICEPKVGRDSGETPPGQDGQVAQQGRLWHWRRCGQCGRGRCGQHGQPQSHHGQLQRRLPTGYDVGRFFWLQPNHKV